MSESLFSYQSETSHDLLMEQLLPFIEIFEKLRRTNLPVLFKD
ncbi:hypothetical protein DSBG_2295 [Desulfosporosinus sp. BG]|nr:hypothetical protein DSBG_2295 [Desulfosporosinus sp. BG]